MDKASELGELSKAIETMSHTVGTLKAAIASATMARSYLPLEGKTKEMNDILEKFKHVRQTLKALKDDLENLTVDVQDEYYTIMGEK